MINVIGTRDISYVAPAGNNVVRKIINIGIDEQKTDDELIAIMSDAIEQEKGSLGENVDAIAAFFWSPEQVGHVDPSTGEIKSLVGKASAVAGVDYAPNGRWEQAGFVGSGCEYDFLVCFNETSKCKMN